MVSPTGAQLRDQGLLQAETNAAADWLTACREAIKLWAESGQEFTSDTIREYVDSLGYTTHEPRAIGAVIRAAHVSGAIRRVGYRPSRRPVAHARPIGVYRGVTA